ncbi:MAG: CxxxxCH/CxxCH domain-containing protein [Myxococcota bacterium]
MRTLPFLVLLVGCATQVDDPQPTCMSCHGSELTGAWPPSALGGITDPTARGVGAHSKHQFAELSNPVACTECHVVPSTVDAEGHIDDPWPADLKWGDLGKTNGAEISWDGTALTCSGTYCHGATFDAPGPHSEPVWIDTSGTQTRCDSCHMYPPPAPHPDDTDCGDCHAPTATGGSLANPATHIDGILQLTGVTPGSCSAGCHGDADQTNPPADLDGNTDTTSPGVGAHEAHLGATLGVPVACSTCHPVPAAVNDGSHLDGTLDLTLGGLAANGGVTPEWDPVALTCTVYCHGASLPGGTVAGPVWNQVDGSQTTCSSCHGNPPPPPHPANPNCGGCHGSGGASDPASHIDGSLDF